MTTYLYHYGKSGVPLLGLFVSPSEQAADSDPDRMTSDPSHRIGVLNFDISQWDRVSQQGENSVNPLSVVEIRENERNLLRPCGIGWKSSSSLVGTLSGSDRSALTFQD
jgi:hypothetical protein